MLEAAISVWLTVSQCAGFHGPLSAHGIDNDLAKRAALHCDGGESQVVRWWMQGRSAAEHDITAGQLTWKLYGCHAGFGTYDQIVRERLRERYGIETEVAGSWQLTDDLVVRAEGYNDRVREEVDRRYGADAISRVCREVEEEFDPRPTPPEQTVNWWLPMFVLPGVAAAWYFVRRVRGKRAASTA